MAAKLVAKVRIMCQNCKTMSSVKDIDTIIPDSPYSLKIGCSNCGNNIMEFSMDDGEIVKTFPEHSLSSITFDATVLTLIN
jgi:hypothetical protein